MTMLSRLVLPVTVLQASGPRTPALLSDDGSDA